jgi:hypothetical protein
MPKDQLRLLLYELEAIRLWDQIYVLSETHDEVDQCAWTQRREREASIYFRILSTTAFSWIASS